MRPRVCLGAAVLMILAACETIPQTVKIDVDGQTLELKRKPAPAETSHDERG
jgi:hypothetical protein